MADECRAFVLAGGEAAGVGVILEGQGGTQGLVGETGPAQANRTGAGPGGGGGSRWAAARQEGADPDCPRGWCKDGRHSDGGGLERLTHRIDFCRLWTDPRGASESQIPAALCAGSWRGEGSCQCRDDLGGSSLVDGPRTGRMR